MNDRFPMILVFLNTARGPLPSQVAPPPSKRTIATSNHIRTARVITGREEIAVSTVAPLYYDRNKQHQYRTATVRSRVVEMLAHL